MTGCAGWPPKILVTDCPGYGPPGVGEMPMGGDDGSGWGWGWDVPQITGNGTYQGEGIYQVEGTYQGEGIYQGEGTYQGELVMCELPETSTTTTSATTTRTTPTQTPTPTMNRADPNQNKVNCFNSGRKMDNTQLQSRYGSSCYHRHGERRKILNQSCSLLRIRGSADATGECGVPTPKMWAERQP